MPQISVVVPVYKVQDKLNKCIDSILKQSFTDFEGVFIDDGTPDLSAEICDEAAACDERFIIVHKQNEGVSVARNVGMIVAGSKYLSFIDSDDYVDEGYLSKLYCAMGDSIQLAICGVRYCNDINDNSMCQADRGEYTLDVTDCDKLALLISDRRLNYVYSKLYLTDLLKQNTIVFNKNVSLGEDTIFVFDYLKHINNVSIVGGSYYSYIKYSSNSTLSSTPSIDKYDRMIYITSYIEATLSDLGLDDEKLNNVISERYCQAAIWSIDETLSQKYGIATKYKVLCHIVGDEELSHRIKCFVGARNVEYYSAIVKKSAVSILARYYARKAYHSLSIVAVKMLPKSVIKGMKKCLRIAQ